MSKNNIINEKIATVKKVLFTATVDIHILNFHLPYLKMFKENGYEVHVATNGNEEIPYCDKKHIVSFERNPFNINNIKAIQQLRKIIDTEKFNIIHCHTPMGGVVTRLAAKKSRKNGTKVIYTAHGFHFYKGAPKLNWLLFYPIEKWLSRYTDMLITINKEDYELAKRKFYTKSIEFVNGIGVDESKFNFELSEKEQQELRKELDINKEDFVIIYAAELSDRKNQGMLIKSVAQLINEGIKIKLLLPGKDSLDGRYQQLAKKLDIESNVKFLGFRKDIPQLLKISNVAISTSRQEGLPVNVIEAMVSGLPIIVTNCRGNRDLIEDGKNGHIVEIDDVNTLKNKIKNMVKNKNTFNNFSVEKYTLKSVLKNMNEIYKLVEKKNIVIARTTSIINDSRVTKEINSFLKNGYNVTVFGWDRDGYAKNTSEILTDNGTAKFIKCNIKCNYGGGIRSIFKMFRFQLWLYENLKKYQKDIDILHCCDLDTGIIGANIAKKYNKKLVYDIFDYYIDSHHLPNFLEGIAEKQEIKVINNSDITIICNEWRTEQIKKSSPNKLIVIHNSPMMKDKQLFISQKSSIIKSNSEKLKLVYVGILQDNRLLQEIAEVVKKHSEIELHIGGFGELASLFEKLDNDYENIFYYGTMKYDDVLKLESECDVLFATYNPDIKNHKYSAPNKLYEAMALGKLIVVCENTGIDTFVLDKNIGRVCAYSADSFEECILRINKNIDLIDNIEELYYSNYDWSCMEIKLIEEYKKL